MFRLLLVLSIALTAGCSAYDWKALTADALLIAVAGPMKADDNRYGDDGEEYELVFWDPNVSACVQRQKKVRNLDQQLDAMFDSVEAGSDYVILPNGERYLVGRRSADGNHIPSLTAECVDQ